MIIFQLFDESVGKSFVNFRDFLNLLSNPEIKCINDQVCLLAVLRKQVSHEPNKNLSIGERLIILPYHVFKPVFKHHAHLLLSVRLFFLLCY